MIAARKQLRGMTAIEVLAATVLASLMLAAVAGLIGGLARQEKILRAQVDSPQWQQQFAEELQWDLQNSRQYLAVKDGLRLEGFAARDYVTGHPTGRRAVIDYFFIGNDDDRWLVRRESHPDEMTNASSRLEIVCSGFQRLQFGTVSMDQTAGSSSGPNIPADTTMTELPVNLSLQAYGLEPSVPLIDRILHLR
jgi:hypothetical protein